jgi:hypothetical protein
LVFLPVLKNVVPIQLLFHNSLSPMQYIIIILLYSQGFPSGFMTENYVLIAYTLSATCPAGLNAPEFGYINTI